MNTDVMFSSKNEIWETPQDFFDKLNEEFHFTLDPCATKDNAKCLSFYTEQDNGLLHSWAGNTVFCNPPYGREKTAQWVRKAFEESKKPDTVVVLLIPARTDTAWFHEYVLGKGEVRFVRGRLKFGGGEKCSPISIYGGNLPSEYVG